MSDLKSSESSPPSILGIHHLKIPTSNLTAKLTFYTTLLSFTHLPDFDHRRADTNELIAVIVQHTPTRLLVELRINEAQAQSQRGWDAITWSVQTRADLERWREKLVEEGVECSRVLRGYKGWVLVTEDPDGAFVRWYCLETHEWDVNIDKDEKWLSN
ncbi:40S ribosomal protein S30 [Favolaschia claudopus]|uniref:40S ribosomal protein S30 n=1 Tax=Favolaschia claudopus TaxID=2862362 RepID=A0AAV9ZKT5_9AGAR